jgi:L-lactate dehydrogenase complex protein LldG
LIRVRFLLPLNGQLERLNIWVQEKVRPDMDESVLTQFKQKYESLAGVVHLVSGVEEAAKAVAVIVSEAKAGRVAFGEFPETLREVLEQSCATLRSEVVQPPYRSADLPGAIDAAQVGISPAEFAIAETGTLVEFATDDALRLVSSLPRVHVGVVRAADLVATLRNAAGRMRTFYEQNPKHATVTFISGPSRTADIEMRLTLGVHGPESAHAVVIL